MLFKNTLPFPIIINPVFIWTYPIRLITSLAYTGALLHKLRDKKSENNSILLLIDTLTVMCIVLSFTYIFIIIPENNILNSNVNNDYIYHMGYTFINLANLFFSVELYLSSKCNYK